MGQKCENQIQCDHHCYKEWYTYDKLADNRRTDELDILVAVDLLHSCTFPKLACSFVDEIDLTHRDKMNWQEPVFHR